MKVLESGENSAISTGIIDVVVQIDAGSVKKDDIDASAYLLNDDKKVRTDADFVFYGQLSADNNSVQLKASGNKSTFSINLGSISSDVSRIALAVAIHSDKTFNDVDLINISIGNELSFKVNTLGMSQKALVLGELYRHNGAWKFRAVGAGFNGGLAPLATSYGVAVSGNPSDASPAAAQAPAAEKISLQKSIEQKAPRLISLTKPAMISLEKRNLTSVKAQVAFVLDCSGSMRQQFKSGNVQAVLDRIAVLAVQFDDNASIDFWAFADKFDKYNDVTLDNLDSYIAELTKKGTGFFKSLDIVSGLGGCNNEPPVMRSVVSHYKDSKAPAFVIFISDGGVGKSKEIESIIRESSSQPVFWKFVGLGGNNYGVLDRLDNLQGRIVDNADFFPIDDFKKVDDTVLYDRLLNEFDSWLKAIKSKGIL